MKSIIMAPLERIERPSANQNELSPTKNERKYDKCSSNQTYTANSAAPVSELPSILASAVRSQRCPRTKKKQLKGRTLKSDNRSRRRLAGWRSTTGMKWNEVKHILSKWRGIYKREESLMYMFFASARKQGKYLRVLPICLCIVTTDLLGKIMCTLVW